MGPVLARFGCPNLKAPQAPLDNPNTLHSPLFSVIYRFRAPLCGRVYRCLAVQVQSVAEIMAQNITGLGEREALIAKLAATSGES